MPDLLAVLKDLQDIYNLRWHAVEALGKIGDRSAVPDLLTVLKDRQEDRFFRMFVGQELGQLGERSVTSSIIRYVKFYGSMSADEENVLRELVNDYTSIRSLARLLRRPDIADEAHEILWDISQREKARICMIDWKFFKLVKVSKW